MQYLKLPNSLNTWTSVAKHLKLAQNKCSTLSLTKTGRPSSESDSDNSFLSSAKFLKVDQTDLINDIFHELQSAVESAYGELSPKNIFRGKHSLQYPS